MKSFRLLAIVLLLCGSVSATQTIVRTITSGDLPYTITQSGSVIDTAVYLISGTKITSATDGITIGTNVSYVMIDGQNDTLIFGTNATIHSPLVCCGTCNHDAGVGDKGINILAGARNWVIKDLNILHDPGTLWLDSTRQIGAVALRLTGSGSNYIRNGLTKNVTLGVKGTHSRCIYNAGGIYNLDFDHIIYWDSCNSWYRRDYWANQSMCNFGGQNRALSSGSDFQYHLRFVNCSTRVAFWNNYHLEGDSTVATFFKCYFTSDGWNRLTGVVSCDGMATATENFLLAFRQGSTSVPDGVKILVDSCVGVAGSNHAGCRGVFISGVQGIDRNDPTKAVTVRNSRWDVHQGWDGNNPTCYFAKIREGWGNIRYEGNKIKVTGDMDTNTSSYGANLIGWDLTSTTGALDFPGDQIGLIIQNNLCSLYLAPSARTSQNWHNSGADMRGAYVIMGQEHPKENWDSIVIRNNHFVTNGSFYTAGWYNGVASGMIWGPNDTLEFYTGAANDAYSWTVRVGDHGNNSPNDCDSNILTDPVFIGGIDDQHILTTLAGHETHRHSVRLQYSCSTQVIGGDNLPIRGATVTYRNAYGNTVYTGTTGTNGRVGAVVSKFYSGNQGAGGDSVFNPITIQVSKGSSSGSLQVALGAMNKSFTMSLVAEQGLDSTIAAIDHFVIDSSQTRIGATIGIPRFQLVAYSTRGWLTVFAYPGYIDALSKRYEMYTTKKLDTTQAARWVNRAWGGTPASASTANAFDHMHLSIYNDTVYGGTDDADNYLAWRLNGDSLTRLWNALWPNNPHNLAIWRLPGSDTALAFGRWSPEPVAQNISYTISTDRGQTFGAYNYFPNGNWSGVGHNIRYGGGYWQNTVFACYDSAHNGANGTLRWWEWNRTLKTWSDLGQALVIPQKSFHDIACNTSDTIRFVAGSANDAVTGGIARDSVCTAIRGANASSWTRLPSFTAGRMTDGTGFSPYVALTNVDSTDRMVLAYSEANVDNQDSSHINIRWFIPSTGGWSNPVKISRGQKAWKISTAPYTPASHGDVAYFQIPYDSTVNGTLWHYTEIVRVRFAGSSTVVEPPIEPPIEPPGPTEPGRMVNSRYGIGVIVR